MIGTICQFTDLFNDEETSDEIQTEFHFKPDPLNPTTFVIVVAGSERATFRMSLNDATRVLDALRIAVEEAQGKHHVLTTN